MVVEILHRHPFLIKGDVEIGLQVCVYLTRQPLENDFCSWVTKGSELVSAQVHVPVGFGVISLYLQRGLGFAGPSRRTCFAFSCGMRKSRVKWCRKTTERK